MENSDPPFVPGKPSIRKYPLERYLPPLPLGIAEGWLKGKIPPGSWVLDPFGASPQLALEIARCGYRVIVAVNNPIMAFMLETLAQANPLEEYQSALAELASARKGEERLEKHIQGLYSIECPHCHNSIHAKAFIWQHPAESPDACLISCPYCGGEGESQLPPSYLDHQQPLISTNLHHSRALERVTLPEDPARGNVELALTCYPSRQLYALFTIINRLEGVTFSAVKKKLMTALIISACDEANTLWPYPAQRSRPRQLVIPGRFKENNLWNALEDAVDAWKGDGNSVPLVRWPALPPSSGGICLFPGRLRELTPNLTSTPISAIVTAIPRPNQAFWTLTALWSGWLWGRDAVTPIKSVLTRQRYDWNWLANALESTLNSLQPQLDPSTPFWGLITETEPTFMTAALLAADLADFEVSGIAFRSGDNFAQVTLKPAEHTGAKSTNDSLDTIARNAIVDNLTHRGEGAPYQVLYTAALSAMARAHALKAEDDQPIYTWLPKINSHIQRLFNDKDWLVSLSNNPTSIEKSTWWLNHTLPENIPLGDRVEMEVVRFIQKHPGASLSEVDAALCAVLPGLLTPPKDLIIACLDSYAEAASPADSSTWQLKTNETPAIRRSDLASIQELIIDSGHKFGFQIENGNPLIWREKQGDLVLAFYLAASAVIGRFVYSSPYPATQCLIILPGSRADLLSFKLGRDPLLNQAITKGWRIIKFRHLRTLAMQPEINRYDWMQQLNSDPIDKIATQIEMF